MRPGRDVVVCRDCCCGTERKHPGVDHDGLLRRLEDGVPDDVRVRVVKCLDECARSNVVVVRDLRGGGRPRDAWFGDVLDETAVDDLVAGLRDEPSTTGRAARPFREGRRIDGT